MESGFCGDEDREKCDVTRHLESDFRCGVERVFGTVTLVGIEMR